MLELAKLFSDGMVLQREKPIHIWGWTEAGKSVSAKIQGKSAKITADANGEFMLILPELLASDSETLLVETDTDKVEVTDIAVGEVYIAGGQSNMEFPLRYEMHREESLQYRDDGLRFFDTPKKYYEAQDSDFDYSAVGRWRKADSEENLGYFSAVAFYFAKEIREKEGVPVGIVGCNWGGTRSCAWMSEDTVNAVGKPWAAEWEKATCGRDMDAFWASRKYDPQANVGNPNTSTFDEIILPGTPSMAEIGAAMMEMAFSTMKEAAKDNPEQAKLLESVMDENGNMNPMAMQEMMAQYQNQDMLDARIKPGILYENMTKKIAPFTARGILWYQGESEDVGNLQGLYKDMLPGLIGDWRSLWKDENLPFIEVQLPGWREWMMQTNLDYATIRRCQEEVADSIDGVYMASISDVGEEHDIHPKDKATVGHRMALLARCHIYGEDILCEAPRPETVKREDDKIIITMKNAKDGLKILGEGLNALKLTASNANISYEASVEGANLILSLNESVEESVLIQFARDDWYVVNLVNAAGIPAIPFEVRC